jgi:membrane protease YdiL (CAAX protease family)
MLNILTITLACIYVVGIIFFCVAFLIDWIRLRKQIRKYLKYGILAGLLIVGFNSILVSVACSEQTELLVCGLAIQPIIFIKVVGFTMLGMHYCGFMGYPSFSLIRRKNDGYIVQKINNMQLMPECVPQSANVNLEGIPPSESDSLAMPLPVNSSAPAVLECSVAPLEINWEKYLASVFAVVLAAVSYSIVLFVLAQPQLSEAAKRLFGTSSPEEQSQMTFFSAFFVLVFAVSEELSFRLSIQSFIARYLHLRDGQYWIAIVITALLWTSGHAGTLDPEWVKMAQIFPVGIMFGWLFKKYGIESSIIAHLLFNLILAFTATNLIR